jgi:hypothetical protein
MQLLCTLRTRQLLRSESAVALFVLLVLQGQAVHITMASSKIALVSACMGSWWTA